VVAPAVVESNNWRLYTGYPAVDWLIVANLSVAVIHEKGNGVGIRTLGVARRRARTVRARLVCLERSLFQATRHRKWRHMGGRWSPRRFDRSSGSASRCHSRL